MTLKTPAPSRPAPFSRPMCASSAWARPASHTRARTRRRSPSALLLEAVASNPTTRRAVCRAACRWATATTGSRPGSVLRWYHDRWTVFCRPPDPQDFEACPWIKNSGSPFVGRRWIRIDHRARSVLVLGDGSFATRDDRYQAVGRQRDRHGDLPVLGRTRPVRHRISWRAESATNVRTVLHANVVELSTPAGGRHVDDVGVATLGGNRFRARARIVLAQGGIEATNIVVLRPRQRARRRRSVLHGPLRDRVRHRHDRRAIPEGFEASEGLGRGRTSFHARGVAAACFPATRRSHSNDIPSAFPRRRQNDPCWPTPPLLHAIEGPVSKPLCLLLAVNPSRIPKPRHPRHSRSRAGMRRVELRWQVAAAGSARISPRRADQMAQLGGASGRALLRIVSTSGRRRRGSSTCRITWESPDYTDPRRGVLPRSSTTPRSRQSLRGGQLGVPGRRFLQPHVHDCRDDAAPRGPLANHALAFRALSIRSC